MEPAKDHEACASLERYEQAVSRAHDANMLLSHDSGIEEAYNRIIDHLRDRMDQIHTSVEERRIYRGELDRLTKLLSDIEKTVKLTQKRFESEQSQVQTCGMFYLRVCPALEAKKREIEELQLELTVEYGREQALREIIGHWDAQGALEDDSRASSPRTIQGREARRMNLMLEDIQKEIAEITRECVQLEKEAESIQAAMAATDNAGPAFGPTTTPLEVWEMIQDIPVITDDEDEDDVLPEYASVVAGGSPLGPEDFSVGPPAIELEPNDKQKSSDE